MIEATRKSLFVSPSTITDEETIAHDMLPVPSRVERDSKPIRTTLGLLALSATEYWRDGIFMGSPQELQGQSSLS